MADKPEEHNPLVGYVQSRFQQAETSRLYDEKRWLKAYRNYRGLYGPEMAFRDSEKSKVFVKVTKRSEERRVGKECRSRWWPYQYEKKRDKEGRKQNGGKEEE